MKWIVFILFFICFSNLEVHSRNSTLEAPVAVIRVYNPTNTSEPCLVEIPVGNIATPGLINWRNVQLSCNGKFLPFTLREGKAHWRAALRSPIKEPQAEDLLVFQISVPPGQWTNIELVPGVSNPKEALTRQNGIAVIDYADMKVTINEQTGLVTNLEAYGESILSKPLDLQFFEVGEEVITHKGSMSNGYHRTVVDLKRIKELAPPVTSLVSWSSTGALTELNFVMKTEKDLSIALTYRIYPNQIEIVSDERPWHGRSPWLDCGLAYNLILAGSKEDLPGFQTHFPFYGFKDYAASVNNIGTLHHGTKTFMFELGEQAVNGRFWHRRLVIYPETGWKEHESLLELLDNGLVVQVLPMSSQLLSAKLQVLYSEKVKDLAVLLAERLNEAGIQAKKVFQPDKDIQTSIVLTMTTKPEQFGIYGDGFCVKPLPDKQGIEVIAGTKLGLFKGTLSITKNIKKTGDKVLFPLVAGNPVVDLRASGLGGINFETDFTHESDAEWENAFNGMISSGMNTITDLGMWSNWQMPVSFKYMPELKSDSSDDYDEVSGTKFSEIDAQREHGLKLLDYLHARGVKVWLWIPVGAIPTTFQKRFPEATVTGNPKTPRFMHQKYRQYLDAYFKEILEVYPLDGFVLIRDDNGGIDETEEFKSYIAQSRTKSAVWEQYLILYDLLRSKNFKGQIAVYPYFDSYEPRLETFLPKDLLVLGHGSGMGVLTRHYDYLGLMPDTWLDNLYANFRIPSSDRMKRLLADRGSYWLGGAYCGTELPWEAIGFFGWQPTATVNSLRYEFWERKFGKEKAVSFVDFSNAYEHLWEIMNDWLMPQRWLTLNDNERINIMKESMHWLTKFNEQLIILKDGLDHQDQAKWFAHVGLYGTFFDYQLKRVELFNKMKSIVAANRQTVDSGNSLSESLRQQLITMNDEIYTLAQRYDEQAAKVPGNMMASTRADKLTIPYYERVNGYDRSLDNLIQIKQFDGQLIISTTSQLKAGQPFELKVELQNRGCVPWITGAGYEIRLNGETKLLGLTDRLSYEGVPIVFGDRRVITIHGLVPLEPGEAQIKIDFLAPFRAREQFLSKTINLKW